MGIHRINEFFVEEFGSPGDLRFRIETDIRIPRTPEDQGFLRRLRNAVESSRHEAVRDFLLERLERPVEKAGGCVGDGSDSGAAPGGRRAQ